MVTDSIKVSIDIIKKIDKRKKDENHTSRDSVVRTYVMEAEQFQTKDKECKEKDRVIKKLKEEIKKLKTEKAE